mmetsp:Transcript_72316/g.182375  ORF Transcript_72316/g.182375 Transcript_72316/m.182375 type:complete len:177 (+) Transcript_72316:48-578(+)
MGSSPSSSCAPACEDSALCQSCTPEDQALCCQKSDDMTLEHQLFSATANGEVHRALVLIREGPPNLINCRLDVPISDGTYMCYSDGATPLHLASLLGEYDLVYELLMLKASPTAADNRGAIALAYAERGKHEAVQNLLRHHLVTGGTTANPRVGVRPATVGSKVIVAHPNGRSSFR